MTSHSKLTSTVTVSLTPRDEFDDRVQAALDAKNGTMALSFDIDRLKGINDTFGHAIGDAALRLFVSRLEKTLRPTDIATRIGGQAFLAVLHPCDTSAALAIARQISAGFQDDAWLVNGQHVRATVSVGVAKLQGHTRGSAIFIAKAADDALAQAKAMGGNRVVAARD